MELYISIIINIVLLFILIARSGKSNSLQIEEKIVYVPEIRYRDKIEYIDRIVYQDKIVKEYVQGSGKVVVNNNFNNTEKKVKKPVRKKVNTVKSEPVKLKQTNSKREEILNELEILRSKKKKSKQDLEAIYTLEMVLPNIK